MPNSLDNLEIQLTKLALRPGDTLQVQLSRHIAPAELNTFQDGLYRLLPAGVRVIVLGPDTQLTHQPAAQG